MMRGHKQCDHAMKVGRIPGHSETVAEEVARGLLTFEELAFTLRAVHGSFIDVSAAAANLREGLRRLMRYPVADYCRRPLVACGVSVYPAGAGGDHAAD